MNTSTIIALTFGVVGTALGITNFIYSYCRDKKLDKTNDRLEKQNRLLKATDSIVIFAQQQKGFVIYVKITCDTSRFHLKQIKINDTVYITNKTFVYQECQSNSGAGIIRYIPYLDNWEKPASVDGKGIYGNVGDKISFTGYFNGIEMTFTDFVM